MDFFEIDTLHLLKIQEDISGRPDVDNHEKSILKCQIRSIQTEGHFGDIKENEDFQRFNYRTAEYEEKRRQFLRNPEI